MLHKKWLVRIVSMCFVLLLAACTTTSTETPTRIAVEVATEAATEAPTVAPTEAPTLPPTETVTEAPTVAATEPPYPGYEIVEEMFANQEKMRQQNAPRVLTLADGTRIQHTPADPIAYNTYFLNADNRGCKSCHADLGQLLRDMPYVHLDLGSMYGIDLNINHCMGCHTYSPGYVTESYGFGRLIHSLHSSTRGFPGDCASCHDVSEVDGKFHLWDLTKYFNMRGITDVPNVQGEFRVDQNVITKNDDLFSLNWLYYSNDYMRYASAMSGKQLDESVFNNWTVSITGEVEKPFTISLPDLIAEAPVEKVIMKMHCTIDPPGSALIENVEITGIPLDYVLEKAGGIKPGATAIMPTSSDGFAFPTTLEHLKTHKAYLVYEINGERLTTVHGYPLQMWVGGMGAPTFVKQLNEIKIIKDPVDSLYLYRGWVKEDGGYFNKPNLSIFYTKDGQIIKAGEPYTFEGYADAYDQPIVNIEISMDRGNTWTKFETPGMTSDKWVYWYFTWTPEAPGSYVIMMRATTEKGLISDRPITLMVNAE